jgi:hypothetical protein
VRPSIVRCTSECLPSAALLAAPLWITEENGLWVYEHMLLCGPVVGLDSHQGSSMCFVDDYVGGLICGLDVRADVLPNCRALCRTMAWVDYDDDEAKKGSRRGREEGMLMVLESYLCREPRRREWVWKIDVSMFSGRWACAKPYNLSLCRVGMTARCQVNGCVSQR